MLCVEHKTKVEELCLLLCVLTVVTQGGQNALRKAFVKVYRVHYHT